MQIKLSPPFAADGAVDPFDVKQMKKALNRLGYYQPYEKVGVTGVPDGAVFTALKKFQQDHNLPATGSAKPDDETIQTINEEAAKTPHGEYIWRTVDDEKVRSSHKALNGTVRAWSNSPDPGEEFNCRCWAEPVFSIIRNEREKNQICIELHKQHAELQHEISVVIPGKINLTHIKREEAIQELEEWEGQLALAIIPSLPFVKGRKKNPDIEDGFDALGMQEQIKNAERIREKIKDLKEKIENNKYLIESLERKGDEAYRDILDVEEKMRIYCAE